MEEIKYCLKRVQERECGIVYNSDPHPLKVFGGIEVDHSLLFVSADTHRNTIKSVQDSLFNPTKQLEHSYAVLCIKQHDVERIKDIFNTTSEQFLNGGMKAYQRNAFFGLYALRYLQSGDAALFIYSNSPMNRGHILDNPRVLIPYFQKQEIFTPQRFLSFSSNHMSFEDTFQNAGLYMGGDLDFPDLPQQIVDDQQLRDTIKKVNLEKDMLSTAIGPAISNSMTEISINPARVLKI